MDERTVISGLYLSWAQGTALYVKYAELRRVSYSELMVLYMLLEAGRLTQRELSLRCELTKQTVNQTVKNSGRRDISSWRTIRRTGAGRCWPSRRPGGAMRWTSQSRSGRWRRRSFRRWDRNGWPP